MTADQANGGHVISHPPAVGAGVFFGALAVAWAWFGFYLGAGIAGLAGLLFAALYYATWVATPRKEGDDA